MSQTIVSLLVILAGTLLPKLGVEIGSEQLTTTVTTILVVGAALWAWVRRVQVGDVDKLGVRKI